MSIASGFLAEMIKIAEGWDTPEEVHRLCDELGVKWNKDPAFMRLCYSLTGKKHLDSMTPEELQQVAREIVRRYGKKGEEAARKATPSSLPKLPKVPKSKAAKSDIVRASDRKKMLLGVKREKAILKMDIMKRIRKNQRLALRPFKGLKKQQREARIGMVRSVRQQARRSYGR